jgi:nucleotidyltransferase/DNA polymerase involved in DNA repair
VLRRPELAGLPVIVGGDGDPAKRGVVATASYEAREKGVGSGTPMRVAARRIPDAVFLPSDKPHYEAVSEVVMATLREFDVIVEVIGWDEAFIGAVTDDPEALARELQARVLERTRLHCSVGIGPNKLQAKMATGFGKPAGVHRLTFDTWFEHFGDGPTDRLWGIGAKTAKKLAGLGIHTVRELAAADDDALATAFGPTIGPWLARVGRGQDRSPVVGTPWARLVAADVAAENRDVARVVVKVRYAPFLTSTHGQTLATPSRPDDVAALEAGARAALERFTERKPVRLLGVQAVFVER